MNRNTTEDNHDAEENLRREVELFRYGLIADLAHLAPGTPGIREQLRAKAEPQYTIPGTLRTRVAAETLRDWLQHYRRGGFDALYPKRRADLGRPTRLPPQAAELLIALKTEHPTWSVRQVIAGAISRGHLPDGVRLAHSTVHRLLRAEGLMSKPAAACDGADRRRFAYRFAGQLWMSDVMHGPTVADGRRRRRQLPHRRFLLAFDRPGARLVRQRAVGDGVERNRLCSGLDHHRPVPVDLPLGHLPHDQGRRQDAHSAGLTGLHRTRCTHGLRPVQEPLAGRVVLQMGQAAPAGNDQHLAARGASSDRLLSGPSTSRSTCWVR